MFVNIIIGLTAILISGMIGYWAQDRDPPIHIKAIEIFPDPVAPGEHLKMRYLIVRHRSCALRLEQIVYDSEHVRHTIEDQDYTASPGTLGDDNFALSIKIPETFASGSGRYRAIRSYYCNPIHYWFQWPIVVVSPEIPIQVEPR